MSKLDFSKTDFRAQCRWWLVLRSGKIASATLGIRVPHCVWRPVILNFNGL